MLARSNLLRRFISSSRSTNKAQYRLSDLLSNSAKPKSSPAQKPPVKKPDIVGKKKAIVSPSPPPTTRIGKTSKPTDNSRTTHKSSPSNSKRFQQQKKPAVVVDGKEKVIPIPPTIRARDLARLLNIKYNDVVSTAKKTLSVTINDMEQLIDQDIASLIAMEFNYLPESTSPSSAISVKENLISRRPAPTAEEYAQFPPRAPVVTIMGHVDHGKTTLLDSLRKTSVAQNEAGGITQHIGAFSVLLPSKKRITFLDTPGHAAFTAMRARGAKVTDLVVLVVAADDGIKPQTIEAIRHAKAASVPIIVAVNKCDKPAANVDKTLYQLMEHGIEPEKLGGDVQCVPVSALKGTGLANLEESILLQADMMDLRGDINGKCEATVIESRMAKGKGAVATILVERGTLKTGDVLVFGNGKTYCKIRSITDENGNGIVSAGPSVPCEISGVWSSIPQAGDEGVQVDSEPKARQIIAEYESQLKQQKSLHDLAVSGQRKMLAKGTLEMKKRLYESKRNRLSHIKHMRDLYVKYLKALKELEKEIEALQQIEAQNTSDNSVVKKKLHVIVKTDVHGSLEAVLQSLNNIGTKLNNFKANPKDVKQDSELFDIKFLHSGVGQVTQSDIELLAATKKANEHETNMKCVLIGFNIPKPTKELSNMIKSYQIPFISQNIIYNLIDDVKQMASGMLSPKFTYEPIGEANVLAVFNISQGKEIIAGCRVMNGNLYRNKNAMIHDTKGESDDGELLYRVVRDGDIVHQGPLKSLKHHKNDVASIQNGMECGLSFGDEFRDVRVGDKIFCVQEVPMNLDF